MIPPGSRSDAALGVAISTMERPDALARCLAALAAGELRPAEVVVVDQSRDDATARVVEEAADLRLAIRYLRQPPFGLGASQNLAFASASTPLLAVTDDDCVPERDWLAVVARTFATRPVDGIAGRVLALPTSGERTYPVSLRTLTEPRDFDGKSLPWLVGSGNNFALRREAYLSIGGCDERLGPGSPARGGVDMDLFYRLLRAGARLRYEPAALVYHERQTFAERAARRPMYGRGIGACLSLWARQRDAYAMRVLAGWLALRAGFLYRGARHGRWKEVREEVQMLWGTVGGVLHGLTVDGPAWPPAPLTPSTAGARAAAGWRGPAG